MTPTKRVLLVPLVSSWLLISTVIVGAYTSSSILSQRQASQLLPHQQRVVPSWRLATRAARSGDDETNAKACVNPCPEPDDDISLDRREAFFSTIGAVWAASTAGPTLSSALATATLGWPRPAAAEYGADAKIELPNPVQSASDHANKQCLVESLGNRECLVYEDPDNKLYQGIDTKLVLGRIQPALTALATIPSLVEEKKWIKITGALTGPMGELIRTMGQLSAGNEGAQKIVQVVKKDLYAIQEAVSRKDSVLILKFHAAATNDMAAFVKSL